MDSETKHQFTEIQRALIPYYHSWDGLEEDDPDVESRPDPPLPSNELVNRLTQFVGANPVFALGLEELMKVQLLTGQRKAGTDTLRKLIALPIKRKPKDLWQLKRQLRNLEAESEPPTKQFN